MQLNLEQRRPRRSNKRPTKTQLKRLIALSIYQCSLAYGPPDTVLEQLEERGWAERWIISGLDEGLRVSDAGMQIIRTWEVAPNGVRPTKFALKRPSDEQFMALENARRAEGGPVGFMVRTWESCESRGWVYWDEDRYRLTPLGRLMLKRKRRPEGRR